MKLRKRLVSRQKHAIEATIRGGAPVQARGARLALLLHHHRQHKCPGVVIRAIALRIIRHVETRVLKNAGGISHVKKMIDF